MKRMLINEHKVALRPFSQLGPAPSSAKRR
jgi:hypothetical protein